MNIETQIAIANNLKLLRSCYGFSQENIASIAHISRTAYTHYELGTRKQDAEVLLHICNFFDINMSSLFEPNPNNFLYMVANSIYSKERLAELLKIYHQLSPQSKAILSQSSTSLLNTEQARRNNMNEC